MRLLLLCLLLLLTGCGPEPDNSPRIRLTTDWYPGAEQGGFYAAMLKGFYRAEGLNVDIFPGYPGASALEDTASGFSTFGLGHSDFVLQKVAGGLPLLAIYAYIPWNNEALMVHAEDPASSIRDLGGHIWLIDPEAIFWRYLTKRFNLKDVKAVNNFSYVEEFLKGPELVQHICVNDEPYLINKNARPPEAIHVFPLRTVWPIQRVVVVQREFAEKHPDILRRFIRATLKGWQDYFANPKETEAYMIKISPRLDAAYVAFNRLTLQTGNFVYDAKSGLAWGRVNPETWQEIYADLKEIGALSHEFDPRTAFSNDYFGGR